MSDIVIIQRFSGKHWRAIDETRLELSMRWLCIQLYTLLEHRLVSRLEVTTTIQETMTFLDSATDDALKQAAPRLMSTSAELLRDFEGFGRAKVSWQRLGGDYQSLLSERKDLLRLGIPVGWIAQRFVLPAFGLEEHDLWHGRVGVGHHAGFTSYDEMNLLSDVGYFLALAREAVRVLDAAKAHDARIREFKDHYELVTRVKANACAYARQSIVACCGFVESFVNGLGLDFVERNPGLQAKHREFLSGREKGRWVSLDRRLEGFPQVIQGASTPPYCVCDRSRRAEPFKTFFEVAVDTRDGAMHAGKGKATIWLGAYEWLDLAEQAVTSSLGVALALWLSCKPGARVPSWLWGLDRSRLLESAEQRIRASDDVRDVLGME